jgi:hypothetical protein
MKGETFEMLRTGENTIQDRNCKFCNKVAQYYRYKENDYVCKEHLFKIEIIKKN